MEGTAYRKEESLYKVGKGMLTTKGLKRDLTYESVTTRRHGFQIKVMTFRTRPSAAITLVTPWPAVAQACVAGVNRADSGIPHQIAGLSYLNMFISWDLRVHIHEDNHHGAIRMLLSQLAPSWGINPSSPLSNNIDRNLRGGHLNSNACLPACMPVMYIPSVIVTKSPHFVPGRSFWFLEL